MLAPLVVLLPIFEYQTALSVIIVVINVGWIVNFDTSWIRRIYTRAKHLLIEELFLQYRLQVFGFAITVIIIFKSFQFKL